MLEKVTKITIKGSNDIIEYAFNLILKNTFIELIIIKSFVDIKKMKRKKEILNEIKFQISFSSIKNIIN